MHGNWNEIHSMKIKKIKTKLMLMFRIAKIQIRYTEVNKRQKVVAKIAKKRKYAKIAGEAGFF